MCWNCKELSSLVDCFNCRVPESSEERSTMCWKCKELSSLVDCFKCSVPQSSKESQQCVGIVKS